MKKVFIRWLWILIAAIVIGAILGALLSDGEDNKDATIVWLWQVLF